MFKAKKMLLVASLVIIVLLITFGIMTKKNKQFDFEQEFNEARKLFVAKNYEQAIAHYEHLLQIDPDRSVVYFNIARAFEEKGELDRAYAYYQQVLALEPEASYADLAHFYSGTVCMKAGNHDVAVEHFTNALAINPRYEQAYLQRGALLQKQNNLDAALADYKEAVALNPAFTPALISVGAAFRDQKDFDKSIASYDEALRIEPNNANFLIYSADALHLQGKMLHDAVKVDQAKQTYKKACELDKNCFQAHHNLGLMLLEQGDSEKALPFFEQALVCNPDAAITHFSLATLYLQKGDFERGFAEYAWRWNIIPELHTNIPRWDGSDISGKTILIHAEQGLGDTFQFIRYAKELKERGAKVIAQVQTSLKPLISLCPYVDTILAEDEAVPPCDVCASLISLPKLFKTTMQTIPQEIPYLFPDQSLADQWRKELLSEKHFKVGICFDVATGHDITGYRAHGNKAIVVDSPKRCIPLEQCLPLVRLSGMHFYYLQKTNDLGQFASLPKEVMHVQTFESDFDEKHGGFMDSAAIIQQLDLVIAVDTAIAHLAGALGVETWVLLPKVAEWRWLRDRGDSPWYPTMRLFRQKRSDDWQQVIQVVSNELSKRAQEKSQCA